MLVSVKCPESPGEIFVNPWAEDCSSDAALDPPVHSSSTAFALADFTDSCCAHSGVKESKLMQRMRLNSRTRIPTTDSLEDLKFPSLSRRAGFDHFSSANFENVNWKSN